jgi:CheY-like chemotaxis protein
LALVKSLIELHGGSTSAKSAGIGAGSEFEVRLPLMVEAMEPCAVPKATAQTPAKSRRVLVVDDNEDVRVSMAMLLRAMGHQVWEAEGGQEALALPGLADLDAVLMDIGMPGLNGYEVARLLRQDPAFDAVILIAMTGYSQEYDRQESLRAGFKHHLVKPFDPAVFADILAEID